jgi:hypothetical protein
MKRILLIAVMVFALHLPALAQDEPTQEMPTDAPTVEVTPIPNEPTSPVEGPARDRTETVLTVTNIVLGTVAVLFGAMIVALVRPQWQSQSPFAQDILKVLVMKLLEEGDRRAALTKTTLDDVSMGELRKVWQDIIAEEVQKAMDVKAIPSYEELTAQG